MNNLNIVIDVIIFLLLLSILAWSALLFWGAYSQHRIAILINENVLNDINRNITNQIKNNPKSVNLNISNDIQQLKNVQKELFDANTISFIFQFVTLLLITVGVAIQAYSYKNFKELQEKGATLLADTQKENEKVQEKYRNIHSEMAGFIKGRNTTVLLAVKYSWLHILCQLYISAPVDKRDKLRTMLLDYQSDIQRHLNYAIIEKEGFEDELFTDVILDAAIRIKNDVSAFLIMITGPEKITLDEFISINNQCLDILKERGKEFVERYKSQAKEIFGTE